MTRSRIASCWRRAGPALLLAALLSGCAAEAPEATAPPSATIAPTPQAASPTSGNIEQGPDQTVAPGAQATASPETDTGVEGATRVLRGYYAAIDARRYAEAYSYWESQGAASGQSFEEFQAGFAETEHVQVELGEPGRIGAAAGSVYISIPVIITATGKDGGVTEYSGSYTLRRTNNVDGSSAWDRAWHLYSAEIVEV